MRCKPNHLYFGRVLLFGLAFVLFGMSRVSMASTGQGAQTFTLDGQLFNSASLTQPLLDPIAIIKVDILDPSKLCVLYEEVQTVNTVNSAGYFNIQAGSVVGAAQRTANDPGNAMAAVFQDATAITTSCAGGYTPVAGDPRYLRLTVTASSTNIAEVMTPDLVLDSVPSALVAESLQGLNRTQVLEIGTTSQLTQSNVENIFSATNYPLLTNLLSGTVGSALTVTAGGKVGIGTTIPTFPLQVLGEVDSYGTAGTAGFRVFSTFGDDTNGAPWYGMGLSDLTLTGMPSPTVQLAGYFGLNLQTGGTQMVLDDSGHVGIGTTSPAYVLDVNGDINIESTYALRFAGTSVCTSAGCTASSDRTLKEKIRPLQNSLDKVLKLQGVEYNYKDKAKFTDKHQVGVIAQDVEKVYPEVVNTDSKTGLKSVAYDHLIAPLIEAFKALYHRVLSIESHLVGHDREIASMKANSDAKDQVIKKLEEENAQIKSYLCAKDPKAPMCN